MLKRLNLLGVLLMVLSIGAVNAQDQDLSTAEAWVQIFADLKESGNYTYEDTSTTYQIYKDAEGQVTFEQRGEAFFTAEVASQEEYNIYTELTLKNSDAEGTYRAELRRVAGELFMQLDLSDIYPTDSPVEGWWREADLLAVSTAPSWQMMVTSMANVEMPFNFVDDPRLILSVTEEEPETIDGVNLQVFTIEIDHRTQSLLDSITSIEDAIELLQNDRGLVSASVLELSYTVWLNPEDLRIYQLEKTFSQEFPFLDFPEGDTMPYNLAAGGEGRAIFTYPTEPLTVVAPTVAELNTSQ